MRALVRLFIATCTLAVVAGCSGSDGGDEGEDSTPSGDDWTIQLRTRFEDLAGGIALAPTGELLLVGSTNGDLPG